MPTVIASIDYVQDVGNMRKHLDVNLDIIQEHDRTLGDIFLPFKKRSGPANEEWVEEKMNDVVTEPTRMSIADFHEIVPYHGEVSGPVSQIMLLALLPSGI